MRDKFNQEIEVKDYVAYPKRANELGITNEWKPANLKSDKGVEVNKRYYREHEIIKIPTELFTYDYPEMIDLIGRKIEQNDRFLLMDNYTITIANAIICNKYGIRISDHSGYYSYYKVINFEPFKNILPEFFYMNNYIIISLNNEYLLLKKEYSHYYVCSNGNTTSDLLENINEDSTIMLNSNIQGIISKNTILQGRSIEEMVQNSPEFFI